jgi:pyruvate,water dikinase
MEKKLLRLGAITQEDHHLIGAKAANLSSLAAAGFKVPEGFVIPVITYNKFLEKLGLERRIVSLLGAIDFEDEASLESLSKQVRDLVLAADVEPWVRREFGDEFESMGKGSLWAVRSSAVAEDLAEASFAGQQDTYLNVRTEDVPLYVKRCWASFYNDRAVAYRHNAGIPQTGGGIAVIVQRMVDARSSGIIFTRDPMDQGGEMIIIESSWGLGESIASGIVVPDRFHCDRRSGRVVRKDISRKAKAVYLNDDGRGPVDLEQGRQTEASISEVEAKQLAALGARMEEHFKAPQDVEWAIADGEVYILQSRPITTLAKGDEILWTRGYGDEYWSDVTSPLFFSWLGEYLTEIVNHEGARIMGYWDLAELDLLRLHKGHVYFNTAVLEGIFCYNPRFSRTKELLNYFPEKDQDRIANKPARLARRLLAELRIAVIDPDGMINRTDKAYRKWAEGFMSYCQRFDSYDLANYTDAALEEVFDELEAALIKHYRLIRYGMVTHSIGTNLMLKRWLMDWLGDRDGEMYSRLISGLPDNKTIKTNIALAKLASAAKGDPLTGEYLAKLPSAQFLEVVRSDPRFEAFREDLDAFLEEYGCRSHTRELFFPRWADDPTLVIDIVRSMSQAQDLDLERMERERIADRQEAEKEVLERLRALKGGRVRRVIVKVVLGYAQTYLQFRENQRFYLDHILLRTRRLFMEYGRRYQARGVLGKREDIFFLSKEEIFQIAKEGVADVQELRGRISSRRSEFERWRNRLPPKFLQGKVEFDDAVYRLGSVVKIPGTSSSPGVARGTVHVVQSIEHLSDVREDEILVTSNTDPGWTAVFSKIGGLVTETGGILSHGAVVSREYGIPAVTAVKGATKILKTGQRVTLDGNEGIIYLEEM